MRLTRLLAFVDRPTSRNIIINTLGNYLNVGFTAFFALLLVRILTPAEYGVLSVLLGIAYVLANILDFGTTATIYSYLPALFEKRTAQLYKFIKSTFYYQSIFSFIVIGVLFITFPFLDAVFFKTGARPITLYLTSFSVLFLIWQNFILNIFFAAKKFMRANIYLNLSNIIKTLVIFVMVATHTITISSIIFVFGIVGPLIFFALLFIEKSDIFFIVAKAEVKREEFRFGYTLTYFLASQFYNLGLRMDLFLLSYFQFRNEVGYYGLAQKIILTIITTIISITQVLSPGFSHADTKKEARHHLKTGFLYLLIPCALFLTLFFLPEWVFDIFFTKNFLQTAAITKALSLPFILYALSQLPLLFLLYTVKKPRPILASGILFFVILTGGCYILIPKMGVMGPPYAIAAALVASTILMGVVSLREYRKLPK